MPTGSDSFNRADAATLGTTDTGQAWSVQEGAGWSIETNKATPTTPSTATFTTIDEVPMEIATIDVGSSRQSVSAVVTTVANGSNAGLVARWIDGDNYLFATAVHNIAELFFSVYEVVGGVFTELDSSTTYVADRPASYELTLSANGDEWSFGVVFLDELGSYDASGTLDPALATGEACGMICQAGLYLGTFISDDGSIFDDFSVIYGTRRNLRALGLRR
jgi:hypothetical protein